MIGSLSGSAAENRLTLLIEDTNLPKLPKVALEVAKLVDSPNASAATVAQTLSRDQTLTAQVLKMANSAFYGAPRRISTVTDAVILLGMLTIRNMTMAVSCQEILEREVMCYSIRRGDLWRHSICVAYAAQQVARLARYRISEEAYVVGLLHDIGKVVVSMRLGAEFDFIATIARDENRSFSMVEREVLGFDHAEVGARLTEHWNLPTHLVNAIRWHHNPSQQDLPNVLTSIVHLADVLVTILGIGIGTDGLRCTLEDGTAKLLNIDANAVNDLFMSISTFAVDPFAAR